MLRELRRRHARRHSGAELTYRELAAATGWSHGIIGEYLAGRVLPPTDRFDTLIRLLGATPAEQGALATARDRVEEARRRAPAARAVPRQLPVDVYGFTGRDLELAELDALLPLEQSAVISAVAGTAGVGKTALAVHWAHRVADRFPDGQLYIDLRGYDPEQPVSSADALAGFLRELGVDGTDIPGELDERAARYRTVLAGRRVLVLLDNASDAAQVRPLLPGTPTCFVLVTSRDDLAGLVAREGARRIDLDLLPPTEAVSLLRTLLGPRVDVDPGAAVALAERCARLPLALRIAAELALASPSRPLSDLVADLHGEQRRLAPFDAAGDPRTAVRSVFSWSYRQLSSGAAHVFAMLGLHPGREADPYSMAALADFPLDRVRALIDELARAHLIQLADPGRYTMHDLLRAYAVERVTIRCDPAERRAALARLSDHYLHTAASAMDTLYPHERGRPEPPHVRTPAPDVHEPDRAMAWLEQQRSNLVAVALYAARHGSPRCTVGLSRTLWRHFEVGGHYEEALAVHTAAAEVAGTEDEATVLANLGSIHWWLGNHRAAQEYFERSLAGHQASGDAEGEARALARLGLVHERLGDYREAVAHMTGALDIFRRTGNRYGEGSQLINLGTLHRRLGRHDEAVEHQLRAAEIFVELGDARLHGYALGNLAAAYGLIGRYDEALAHLTTALANCRESGDRGGEGSALGAIGTVYGRMGRHAEALDELERALEISRETADRGLETEMLNTLGETLLALNRPGSARDRHQAAFELTEQTGDRYEHARALAGLARAVEALGSPDARTYWRQALALYDRLGVPEADEVRRHLQVPAVLSKPPR